MRSEALLERNLIPDWMIRFGIRRLLRARLAAEGAGDIEAQQRRFRSFLHDLESQPIAVENVVDMPDRTIDLLFRFLRQNGGRLSRRARSREFAELTDEEAMRTEEAYDELFGDASNPGG